MGARKGQNNFKRHQSDVEGRRLAQIATVLKAIGRQQSFGSFHALSRYVAHAVGIDPTTVSRNARYRKAVWDAVTARPGIIRDTSADVAPVAALQVGKIVSDLDAAALRRENERLRRLVERIGSAQAGPSIPDAAATGAPGPLRPDRAFEDTALVLSRLLDHLAAKDLGIGLDEASGTISDAGEAGTRATVAGRPETKPFVEWLSRHRAPR